MTLAELLTTLETKGALTPSRVKDIRTSLRYLAEALGHPGGATSAPVDEAWRDPARWMPALDAYFATPNAAGQVLSAVTRRNTRNNLRVVFRAAAAQGLLESPATLPLARPRRRDLFMEQQRATAPYQQVYRSRCGPPRFGLPTSAWPADIAQGWQDYQARCDLRIRQTTLAGYENRLTLYLGYLAHIVGRTPTWDDCFDPAPLRAFVRWHATRVSRTLSCVGEQVVVTAAALAKVIDHPNAPALAALRRALPPLVAVHDKQLHWVSLAQLEAVADACLREGRLPWVAHTAARYPGANRASVFQKGVMLKLLVRVPLRSRNVRGLRLDKHLYEDRDGHWQIHFKGDDLKIGTREYRVDMTDYAPAFLGVLKEFTDVHRPRIQNAVTSPYLFVTREGNPFGSQSLKAELTDVVAMRTGQRFYPHLIRSIWATEYLTNPDTYGDYEGAAYMLGDTVEVVIQSYSHLFKDKVRARHKAFLARALQRA